MSLIPQIATAMQHVLSNVSDKLGDCKQFIQRHRKLTGGLFVQTLVFTWLAKSSASDSEMSQTAASLGVSITPQAIEQRFTKQAADMLLGVFEEAVLCLISDRPVKSMSGRVKSLIEFCVKFMPS